MLSSQGSQQDYLQVLNLPPPFADRFWFLKGTATTAGNTWMFFWERIDGAQHYPDALSGLLEKSSGAVEVGVNVGSWSLIEGEGSRIARFRSCTDVGGSVPRWAGEKAARLMLPNNIVDLFAEGQRRR